MTVRVMVVDDSALYRQLVRNVLRDIPGVEVVGTAKSGQDALDHLAEFSPQLMTLDVEMPGINGIGLLKELRERRSPVKAIMLSSYTAAGARTTTDALLAGAFDFIQKPNSVDAEANRSALLLALTEKIAAFVESRESKLPRRSTRREGEPSATGDARLENQSVCAGATTSSIWIEPGAPAKVTKTSGGAGTPASSERDTTGSGISKAQKRIDAVVIATSTGGPVALREVLPKLPAKLGVPVFVAQHMPARFTHSLAARLAEASEMPIIEGADGMLIVPDRVYIAPGGLHMKVIGREGHRTIQTTEDPPEHNCRPAADYLLRSVATQYEGRVLVVVLTGMGRDGTEGCRLVKRLGGKVIAQHPDGCVVYGMPKAVVEEQLADRVVPLEKVASWIVRIVQNQD